MNMKIIPNQFNQCNFTSNYKKYKSPYNSNYVVQDEIYTTTFMFRNDLNWKELIPYIDMLYKDKEQVNIYNVACSDGSEPYTLAISILEQSKNPSKYFPIKASDIHKGIIKDNINSKILLTINDFKQLANYTSKTYFNKDASTPRDVEFPSHIPAKPIKELRNKVEFKVADLLSEIKKIKDNSNTIILCRNVSPYLPETYVEELVKTASEVLKKDSLLIIGSFDSMSDIKYRLLYNNFVEIKKNILKKV